MARIVKLVRYVGSVTLNTFQSIREADVTNYVIHTSSILNI